MRRTAFGAALLVMAAAPTLLGELGHGGFPLAERSAHAQPADAVTEVARQRYQEGVKAFDAGKFEDARAAFLQAYALKRHPAVLLNLGLSEVKSGHYEDGGNHLQQYLRENPSSSPDQRASVEKAIAEAKKKSGFVVVIVDANGADVSVDGTAVGKAPLLDPIFVKPGRHTLLATYQGRSATAAVDAKAGTATAANLQLGTTGAPVAAPVPVPAPGPAALPGAGAQPTPSPSPAPSAAYPPSGPSQLGAPAQEGPPVVGQPPPDQATTGGEREPFFHWYGRKPLAWVGTGLAGVGLVVGIIGSSAAGKASSAADQHTSEIKNYSKTDPTTGFGQKPPCGSTSSATGDLPGYEKACTALRKDMSDYNTDVAVSAVGWVGFGLGVVGTVTYALIDWLPKKNRTADLGPKVTAITPIMTLDGQRGFGVLGTF
jgi:hypothetical protein